MGSYLSSSEVPLPVEVEDAVHPDITYTREEAIRLVRQLTGYVVKNYESFEPDKKAHISRLIREAHALVDISVPPKV